MTCLIVDDNPRMRELIASIVGDVGDHIFECGDGGEALEAYRASRPDWVLMDIKVGSVDGIAATRQIKSAFPSARIVIVTKYDDPELRAAARDAGACGYVVKGNLLVLRRVLAAKHTTDADERTP
jgi:CheY-like chemotaxis protein